MLADVAPRPPARRARGVHGANKVSNDDDPDYYLPEGWEQGERERERETVSHARKRKCAPDTTKVRASQVERHIERDSDSDQTNWMSLDIYFTTRHTSYSV